MLKFTYIGRSYCIGFQVLTAVVMKSWKSTDIRFCLPPAFTLVSCSTYSSNLKLEATCSSGTSLDFQRTIRRYIPKDRTLSSYFNSTGCGVSWYVVRCSLRLDFKCRKVELCCFDVVLGRGGTEYVQFFIIYFYVWKTYKCTYAYCSLRNLNYLLYLNENKLAFGNKAWFSHVMVHKCYNNIDINARKWKKLSGFCQNSIRIAVTW
jgi:hypothetical protein